MKNKNYAEDTIKGMHVFHLGDNQLCYSYEKLVAVKVGDTYYQTIVKYSPTTTKHVRKFLNGNPAEMLSDEELAKTVSLNSTKLVNLIGNQFEE